MVPNGFVVTADSYDYFITHNNLNKKIQDIIVETNIDDFVDLTRNSLKIRNLIVDGEIPDAATLITPSEASKYWLKWLEKLDQESHGT